MADPGLLQPDAKIALWTDMAPFASNSHVVQDHIRPITTNLARVPRFDDDNPDAYTTSSVTALATTTAAAKTFTIRATQIPNNLNMDSKDNGSAPVNFLTSDEVNEPDDDTKQLRRHPHFQRAPLLNIALFPLYLSFELTDFPSGTFRNSESYLSNERDKLAGDT